MTTTSKASARDVVDAVCVSDWTLANTCCHRSGRAPPTYSSPKFGVGQDLAIGPQGLLEDLAAMGDEQQPWAIARALAQSRGSPRPRPRSCRSRSRPRRDCGGDRGRCARLDRVEHLLLVGIGPHLEARERERHAVARASCPAPRRAHRRAGRGPARGRRARSRRRSSRSRTSRANLSSSSGVADSRQTDVPLDAFEQGAGERLDEPT